ncbi:two-component sensor histidine kinase [Paractinoplanes abujensis]|uniref:histidine kinase n=1 Tax=Paractinoplanes abujensis TaxID=882441 RepID=A0A7W7CNG0_9ACTN|nr:histidine kinase [Actinoplanes abujensis]MBB4691772.1 signal transduction histidine kinase [Actinoplanes abujensis]GID16805.1 two-component sensor histidine kinase [Actinoplanes abujensis]
MPTTVAAMIVRGVVQPRSAATASAVLLTRGHYCDRTTAYRAGTAYGRGVFKKRWLADLVVIALFVATVISDEIRSGATRPAVVIVCGVVAVLARHRWPVAALVLAGGGLIVSIVLHAPAQSLLLLLGFLMYAFTLRTSLRRPWLCSLGAATVVFAVGMIADPAQWWSLNSLGLYAWIGGGGAVGEAVRNRRAYLAELTERVRQAEQFSEQQAHRRVMDERLRIARELHDVVAHHIAVINVQAGAAAHVVKQHPEQAGPALEVIRQSSDSVLQEIKSVIGVLRDPAEAGSTEPSPGLSRVPALLDGLVGFDVAFTQIGQPRELPAIADLAAYRIVQEALTNAHRYGDTSATLVITYAENDVTIEVTNRIAGHGDGTGFGLIGMRERAAAAGGSVTAGPAGHEFRVHAGLPAPSYALETSS